MLRPSYTDLINAVNSGVEPGEQPVVQSRYSIVIAAAKRARQIVDGSEPFVAVSPSKKALSTAVQELYEQKVSILAEDASAEAEETNAAEAEEVTEAAEEAIEE